MTAGQEQGGVSASFAARRAGSLARVRMQLETERFLAKNRGDLEWAANWNCAVQAIARLELEIKPFLVEDPSEAQDRRAKERVVARYIRGVLRERMLRKQRGGTGRGNVSGSSLRRQNLSYRAARYAAAARGRR